LLTLSGCVEFFNGLKAKNMKYEIEMTQQDIKDLLAVRNYFGENDRTMFEHKAYAILDRLVKKLNTPRVSVSFCQCNGEFDTYLIDGIEFCYSCNLEVK